MARFPHSSLPTVSDRLAVLPQYLMPKRALTVAAGKTGERVAARRREPLAEAHGTWLERHAPPLEHLRHEMWGDGDRRTPSRDATRDHDHADVPREAACAASTPHPPGRLLQQQDVRTLRAHDTARGSTVELEALDVVCHHAQVHTARLGVLCHDVGDTCSEA